jgi:hypothetical protein
MSIRFACKCGKHLRAGDTMLGRHTLCPKCGALVAIVPRDETASGVAPARPRHPKPRAEPLLPPRPPKPAADSSPQPPPPANDDAEEIGPVLVRVRRRNDKDPNQFRRSIWVPLDPERGPPPEKLPKPVRTSRRRYEWKLETHWFKSLGYPFRAWRLLLALAVVQSATLAWLALLLPRLNGVGTEPSVPELMSLALVSILVTTYTVGLLDCVLSSAGDGEYRVFRAPGPDLGAVGLASWFVCFLAGPIVPAVIGIEYWARCGDPDVIDRTILVELAAVTFGYWLLQILAAREEEKLLADPAAVATLAFRMGPRALLAAVGAPVMAFSYSRLATFGLVRFHVSGPFGLFWLVAAQFAGMFGTIFLLRVLGVWSYRSRPAKSEPPILPASEPIAATEAEA